MSSKEALLNQLSVRKLKQLAKENKVLLVRARARRHRNCIDKLIRPSNGLSL